MLNFLGAAILIAASLIWEPAGVKDKKFYIAPPAKLMYFSFGQQLAIGDGIWVRVIPDIDFCNQPISKNVCTSNDWLFTALNTLTSLAPDYLIAYREGGTALSVLLSDVRGAAIIFDKGLAVIQNDWNLYYRAAYHALLEEKDRKKAADRFLAAAKLLGPKGEWFYNRAGELYNNVGEREIALKIYSHMGQVGVDDGYLKRMREKIGITDDEIKNIKNEQN